MRWRVKSYKWNSTKHSSLPNMARGQQSIDAEEETKERCACVRYFTGSNQLACRTPISFRILHRSMLRALHIGVLLRFALSRTGGFSESTALPQAQKQQQQHSKSAPKTCSKRVSQGEMI